jgi:hypothetical protein
MRIVRKPDRRIFVALVSYSLAVAAQIVLGYIGGVQCLFQPSGLYFLCDIGYFVMGMARDGVIQNVESAVLVGGWLYFFRGSIRRLFMDNEIRVRSPLMLAAAPIILAEDDSVWNRVDYRFRVDFRYAGFSALEDLSNERCQAAVVSDIALLGFLGEKRHKDLKFFVIPFTRVTDNIRFVVRKNQDGTLEHGSLEEIRNGNLRVGCMSDTVHSHFLSVYLPDSQYQKVEVTSPILGLEQLLTRTIDTLVLWEPHYMAFDQFAGVGIVDPGESGKYSWFLCLVVKRDKMLEDDRLRYSLFAAIESGAERCRVSQSGTVSQAALKCCYERMNGEFMGLDETTFINSLDGNTNFTFGVADNKEAFAARLDELLDSPAFGVGAVSARQMLWSEFNPRR